MRKLLTKSVRSFVDGPTPAFSPFVWYGALDTNSQPVIPFVLKIIVVLMNSVSQGDVWLSHHDGSSALYISSLVMSLTVYLKFRTWLNSQMALYTYMFDHNLIIYETAPKRRTKEPTKANHGGCIFRLYHNKDTRCG